MNEHGLLAVAVTLILAAMAATWRLASLATRLEQQLDALRVLIPEHEKRMTSVEATQSSHDKQLALIVRDLQSIIPPRPRQESYTRE